jgi:hypothetical protein
VEASVTPELSPTSPDERIAAIGIAPAIAKPTIPFAGNAIRPSPSRRVIPSSP